MQATQLIVSGAVVAKKDSRGRYNWLLVKQGDEDGWEIAKVTARKGESSVRAAIRMMAELGGMNAKVLEEVGRSQGSTNLNGKVVSKRMLYYLMIERSGGETLGFKEAVWLDFRKASSKLESKKEKDVLGKAKKELEAWVKAKKDIKEEEEWLEEQQYSG